MLIDVHAHFYHRESGRLDGPARNASRLAAGDRIGVSWHVASVLGSWGHTSPTYFPSKSDLDIANEFLVDLTRAHPTRIKGYVCLNPNYTDHALAAIEQCAAAGMIGVKLAASRRADDPLLDPIAAEASRRGLPVLHHIWQNRRRDWPGQEASDASELARLARRHPGAIFILAHIGGGGDWLHSLHAVRAVPNIMVDLSGSGVDAGMLEACVRSVGPGRLLWGADLTLCTGWAKLRYLEHLLPGDQFEQVAWRNAVGIFPPGSFGV